MDVWLIAPLGKEHDRAQFSCGEPSLDRFLKESARQNQDKDFSRTFVLTRENGTRILGYYSLTAGEMERASLPPEITKKLPKYPVPVVILGRLAVDQSVQGKQLGDRLLRDALDRCLSASTSIGIHAVVVDAISERAKAFYEKFGILPMIDSTLRAYLPLATVRKARRD
jgi:predicted GNAT family N-acyltransferase